MITTRESINFQFSLIFGYSSPTDLIAGDVIGPGKLTKEMVNELSKDVITYLRMYNAMLRDFAGSEVFSIEFELYNFDQKDAQMKIYPKSMVLIPGKYKECESLLLALKPETGYLDPHKSRESINHISKLFYEVEEFSNHPGLEHQKKIQVYNKFATRFSKKLYGDLIEDKWNKKLIGLSVSLPTEKEMLSTYGSIRTDVDYLWNKSPIEIKFSNQKYDRLKSPYIGKSTIDHLKYAISEPSATFIIEKTLILGTNLLKLANTGTTDEIQEKVISFFVAKIEESFGKNQKLFSGVEIISYMEKILTDFNVKVDNFLKISKKFLTTGEIGNISELLEKYNSFIVENSEENIDFYRTISELAINSMTLSIISEEKLRASELDSVINYFAEVLKNSISCIRNSFPRYLSHRRLNTLISNFIRILHVKFENEQKPSKNLGQNILGKFEQHLISQIAINPIVLLKVGVFNEEILNKEFKKLVNDNIKSFYGSINLDISDLIAFAEIQMEKDSNLIDSHVKKFERFSDELKYLLSYILRYTTINRFLKEEPDGEISDPVTFANRFHRFLEKRIGAINLTWKTYILEWIKDYAKKFFSIEEIREWSLDETLFEFIKYLEERESNEQEPEAFLKFLDNYILRISNDVEKEILIDFYKQYEFCIGIKTEFPKYIQNKVEKEINLFKIEPEKIIPKNYLSIDEQNTFYNYVKKNELRYFSKLIPRPVSLILKQELTAEEVDLFKADLFHVFEFKYWHNKAKYDIADNFKEVYREWIKKL
ncbi:MAG: hypothetical protein E3J90_13465 [Promethearchaeota archaeon]|nr:MAG: hypothetical protein E3J90_13465 [Candidatus Lokiarchaeota archaeon]